MKPVMGRMLVAGAALLMLAVFNAFPAFGGPSVRTVTNTNDGGAGSLRQAIIDADASNTDDTIVFQSGVTGTITLTSGALSIVFPINIVGPGVSNLAISGGGTSSVLLVNRSATASISGLTIEAGQSDGDGSGIENFGTLTLSTSTVSGNNSGGLGGGVLNSTMLGGGTMTLINSTFSDNSGGYGGGIFNQGTLTLTNSTVANNTADLNGVGIINGGTLTVTNSTVSGNSSGMGGGAFYNGGGLFDDAGTMTLINSTLSGNSDGIENDEGGNATLKNTMVANSLSGANCISVGTFNSDGHNLSDDKTCGTFFIATGDINNTPAGLDPGGLKDNGGPTQTIALLATSAAVDAVPVSPTNNCTANRADNVLTRTVIKGIFSFWSAPTTGSPIAIAPLM